MLVVALSRLFCQVEAVEIHYLVPGSDKVSEEFFLRISAGVNLCNCPQLRVRAERIEIQSFSVCQCPIFSLTSARLAIKFFLDGESGVFIACREYSASCSIRALRSAPSFSPK